MFIKCIIAWPVLTNLVTRVGICMKVYILQQPAFDTMNVKKYWFNTCTLNYILIYCVYLPNFESLLNNSYKVNKCTTREYRYYVLEDTVLINDQKVNQVDALLRLQDEEKNNLLRAKRMSSPRPQFQVCKIILFQSKHES